MNDISSVLPKVLVNYYQDPILVHQINLYKNIGAEEIWVLVLEKDVEIVRAVLEDREIRGVQVFGVDKALGSAYAISYFCEFGRNLNGKNVVFNWSDVLPEFSAQPFWRPFWRQDAIYTFGDQARFLFSDGKMDNLGKTGGNVIGVFQFRNFTRIDSEGDLVEVYDLSNFTEEPLESLVDIGDLEKLRGAHSTESRSRSWNTIEIKQDCIVKQSTVQDIISKEVEWYKAIDRHLPRNQIRIANFIHQEDKLYLERIFGKCLSEFSGRFLDEQVMNLINFTRTFPISVRPAPEVIQEDYKIEFLDKVHQRNGLIKNLIDQFSEVKVVNGTRIDISVGDLINETYNRIVEYLPDEYTIIHGDPNFSNVLTEIDGSDLVLIDPRGYFGNTRIYGPRDYDMAKYLYALSGYDKFNHQPDWTGLRIEGQSAWVSIEPLDQDWETHPSFKRVHRLMLGVIWLCLAGYFRNNPYKSLAAYFYGLYLMRKNLEDDH